MKIEELRDFSDRLHLLLADPQPGLATWREGVADLINPFTERWNAAEQPAPAPTISPGVLKIAEMVEQLLAADRRTPLAEGDAAILTIGNALYVVPVEVAREVMRWRDRYTVAWRECRAHRGEKGPNKCWNAGECMDATDAHDAVRKGGGLS